MITTEEIRQMAMDLLEEKTWLLIEEKEKQQNEYNRRFNEISEKMDQLLEFKPELREKKNANRS